MGYFEELSECDRPLSWLFFQERAAKKSMSKDDQEINVIKSRPYITAGGGSSFGNLYKTPRC